MDQHERLAELGAAYALGALEGEELVEFQRHLAERCPECESALRDYQEAQVRLAADLPQVELPPSLKAALLRRLDVEDLGIGPPAATPGMWRRVASVGALAAGIAAVIAGMVVSAAYERRLDEMNRELSSLRARFMEQREILGLLEQSGTQVVALSGLTPSPGAWGWMVWHERAGGFFSAAGLPSPPSDKTYQLWALTPGKPLGAGVFNVDPTGRGRLRVKPEPGLSNVQGFAVTLEPAGGLPGPSGEMYLAGQTS